MYTFNCTCVCYNLIIIQSADRSSYQKCYHTFSNKNKANLDISHMKSYLEHFCITEKSRLYTVLYIPTLHNVLNCIFYAV